MSHSAVVPTPSDAPAASAVTASPIGLTAFNYSAIKTAGQYSALNVSLSQLSFKLGKPAGGGCIMVNPASVGSASLVKRSGNGNAANYYRPDDDPRWQLPAVKRTLAATVIVPAVTLTKNPEGWNIPFLENWPGSAEVLRLLSEPNLKGMYYAFQKASNAEGQGGYIAKPVDLAEPYLSAYATIKWPSFAEAWASIPVVSFDRMVVEDYKYRVLAGVV